MNVHANVRKPRFSARPPLTVTAALAGLWFTVGPASAHTSALATTDIAAASVSPAKIARSDKIRPGHLAETDSAARDQAPAKGRGLTLPLRQDPIGRIIAGLTRPGSN